MTVSSTARILFNVDGVNISVEKIYPKKPGFAGEERHIKLRINLPT